MWPGQQAALRAFASARQWCVHGVSRILAMPSTSETGLREDSACPLKAYVQELLEMHIPSQLTKERDILARRIQAAMQSEDNEQISLDAIAAIRIFHETAWNLSATKHAALRAEARVELAALQAVLSTDAFEAAVEEVARDIIRRAYPLVSATAVWDRLSGK